MLTCKVLREHVACLWAFGMQFPMFAGAIMLLHYQARLPSGFGHTELSTQPLISRPARLQLQAPFCHESQLPSSQSGAPAAQVRLDMGMFVHGPRSSPHLRPAAKGQEDDESLAVGAGIPESEDEGRPGSHQQPLRQQQQQSSVVRGSGVARWAIPAVLVWELPCHV